MMQWSMMVLLVGLIGCERSASELVAEYTKRLCNNEPTCSFVNHPSIPKELRTLEKRNCLCDSDCKEYKDCCIDSMFYRIRDQLPPFSYYCSANKKVYMKIRCLAEWTDQNMVSKCQKSILPLEDDLAVITPLTHLVTGITYGNVYCAVCNNAFTAENTKEFYTWTLSTRCGQLPYAPPAPPTAAPTQPPTVVNFGIPLWVQAQPFIPLDLRHQMILRQLHPALNDAQLPTSGYYLLVLLLYYIQPPTASVPMVRRFHPPTTIESDASDFRLSRDQREASLHVDFDRHVDQWAAIALNASYDPHTKLWLSHYRNGTFLCEYESMLPSDNDVPLRMCVPNVISECSIFDSLVDVHECRLQMQVVYDKRGLAFRNKHCALCNGVLEDEVFVCPHHQNGQLNFIDDAL